MSCPRCRHENPPGAKFNIECASPLPPAAQFCPECAHPTDRAPARALLDTLA